VSVAVNVRLDRWLSGHTGRSRTEVGRWIRRGRVEVGGEVVRDPGTHVAADAAVTVDGERVSTATVDVMVFHKPVGVHATVGDPWGRPSLEGAANDLLRDGLRPVGRLDAATDGLLLFVRDGAVTQRLLHPKRAVPRVYVAMVEPRPNRKVLTERLAAGVLTSDGVFRGEVREVDGHRVVLAVTEGKHHLVRRMLANAGHPVVSLRRIAFGAFELGDLAPGAWREPTETELAWLTALKADS
jgi:23S rRNA pseudouridine2605 synthase